MRIRFPFVLESRLLFYASLLLLFGDTCGELLGGVRGGNGDTFGVSYAFFTGVGYKFLIGVSDVDFFYDSSVGF